MCVNNLLTMLPRIFKQAGLQQKYPKHCLCRTPIHKLLGAGLDRRVIMTVIKVATSAKLSRAIGN